MSNYQLSQHARAALAVVAAVGLLGCASGGAREREPLARPPLNDNVVVPEGDGKTLETMMAGRFSGVTVTPAANGGIHIRIRGGSNTFYGSNEPLYILDDVALPEGSGGVVQVNPHDILKIEVLKNPQDTAIYGVRGSNGVVKITTKKPVVPRQ